MAARRLILVMLFLLGVSTAIAVIAPDPVEQTAETGQTGETGATDDATGAAPGEAGATGTTGPTGGTGPTGTTGATGAAGQGGSSPGAGATGQQGPVGKTERSEDGRTVSITTTIGNGSVDICVRPETRLILTLRTEENLDISIPEFGRTATATRFAPAVFDLLLPTAPGSFAVEQLDDERRLATVNSTAGCDPVGASQGSQASRVD